MAAQSLSPPLPTTSVSSTLMMHKTTNNKRVQFHGKVSVREIFRLGETPNEKAQFWYTQQQYDTIRIRDRRIIGMMNDNNNDGNKESIITCCTRGLEYRTREVTCHRRNVREAARSAVLEEQTFQREHNFQDHDTISFIYYEMTKHSQRDAQIMGLNDERYVREHLVDSDDVVIPSPTTTPTVVDVSNSNNMEVVATSAARLVVDDAQTPPPSTTTSSSFFGKNIIAQHNEQQQVAMPDNSDHRRRLRRSAGAAAA